MRGVMVLLLDGNNQYQCDERKCKFDNNQSVADLPHTN